MTMGAAWCEVRTTNGNDSNGGGFSVSGNTYSTTGGATNATTASPTFTGGADYTIANADSGDYIFLVSGSNAVPGIYKMTVSGGVCTLDRACGTSATLTVLSWSIIRCRRNTPYLTIDNAAVTTSITTTAITFTGGYTPSKADVGNWVNMSGGTNVTDQWYQIKSVAGSVWTMDSNVVTSGTTTNATGIMGGAVATLPALTQATTGAITANGSASTRIFWRSESTVASPFVTIGMSIYGVSSTPSNTVMSNAIIGYYQEWGDITGWPNFTNNANRPVVKHSAVTLFAINSNGWRISNFICDGASKTNGAGIIAASSFGFITVYNCMFKNYGDGSSGRAIYLSFGDNEVICCEFFAWNTRQTSPADGGVCGLFSVAVCHCSRCLFHDGTGPAFSFDPEIGEVSNCLFVNIAGSTAGWAAINTGNGNSIISNTVVNCAQDGMSFDATSAGLLNFNNQAFNNLLVGCGRYGMVMAKTIGCPAAPEYDGNCYIANATGTRLNADDAGATNAINYAAPYVNALDVIVGPASGGSFATYNPFVKYSLPVADLVVDGSNNLKVTSASHNFTSADLQATIYITNQSGGWNGGIECRILSTAGNAAFLDKSPGATSSTAGNWYFNNFAVSPASPAFGKGAPSTLPGLSNGASPQFGVFGDPTVIGPAYLF